MGKRIYIRLSALLRTDLPSEEGLRDPYQKGGSGSSLSIWTLVSSLQASGLHHAVPTPSIANVSGMRPNSHTSGLDRFDLIALRYLGQGVGEHWEPMKKTPQVAPWKVCLAVRIIRQMLRTHPRNPMALRR